MIDVSTEFKTQTKKVKNQDIKLEICDGELTVKEIHMMPVHIFNALPVWKLRARRQIIAKELRYSFDGQLFKTIMKQIEINIKNAGDIKEKDVNFKYGLFIKNKYEYVNLGNYFIKDIEDSKKKNEMLVTGYDRMIRFMKIFKQSEIGLSYPCRLGKLTQRIGEICDVELYNTDFFNSDLEVSEDFFSKQDLTYRDILDKIAQVTLSTIFIKENKLYIKSVTNEVLERLDKSYVTDLVIKEKFGPLNALVLGRGDIEDNIEETDQKSIEQNGRCEIRFDENEFIGFQREKVIKEMFNQIKGLEYYAFEASDLGVLWLEPGDCIELGDREDNFYKSYYLKANITINTGIVSDSEAEMLEESNTEYKVTTKEEKRTLKVERLAKKNEGLIQDLTQETTENTEKLTKHEQTIDSISDKVSHIEETTNTIEGNKTIQLGNAIAGELIELHIYGNNDVFSYLTISDDVVLSDDLYLLGDSIVVVKDSKGNSKEYELGITEPLRQKDDVYDEYVLKDGKAKIIRRINDDGQFKANEEIEDLGTFSIELSTGTNTISIKNYTASLKAKFAIQNDMTNIYASKVEMNSAINQTAEQVDINVNKKLKSYSKTTEMNTAIKLVSDNITSEVNKKVGKTEVGTYIQQNVDAVKLAWNQISEFIQMMIINNNASFAILDSNKKVLMALDKTGQHFYKSDGTTIFGDMGVQKEDNDQYIAFSVLADYNQKLSNGMAWGIKTKSDNKFHPIFYIKNFEMAEKDSDSSYGELVLSSCNILLDGISTGIIGGNIKMYADEVNSAIQFINTDTNTILLSISTQDLESGYAKIKLLDNISFYKNVGGTNSFRLGSGNNYTLIEDDGSISAYGGTIRFGITGREVSFDLYVKNMASIYGNLNVNGNVYANNISSDRRIKDNIKDCDIKALNIINKIQHKQFDKKDDGKHYNIGYIAQDMEEIDPNFIIKREKTDTLEERYYINELPIIATLSKAIQELSQQVKALQNEVKVLKEEKQ